MDDDRKLTVIVVPHGDLETRSYEIPYGRLKLAIAGLVLLFLAVAIVLATWFPVLAQSTRVRSLERQLEALEEKQAEVVKLAEALEEVEAQYERVRTLLGADAPVEGQPPLLPPLRRDTAPSPAPTPEEDQFLQGVIDRWPLGARGFITRVLSEARPSHPGLDIAVPENSSIRPAGPGIVRSTGEDRVYGRYAIIDHGNGLETLYGHASRILVRAGARVSGDDVIGLTGSTGQSTGPHLHFEVRRDGRAVDPLFFVRQP